MAKPTRRQRLKQRHATEHDFNELLRKIEPVLEKRFHAGDPEAVALVNRLAQLAQIPESRLAKFVTPVKNEIYTFVAKVIIEYLSKGGGA